MLVGVFVGVTGIQLFISQPKLSIIDIQKLDSVNPEGNSNEKGKSDSLIVEINSQLVPFDSQA